MQAVYVSFFLSGSGFGLGVVLLPQELGKEFMFINLYGPYYNKVDFWEDLLSKKCLDSVNLILRGD